MSFEIALHTVYSWFIRNVVVLTEIHARKEIWIEDHPYGAMWLKPHVEWSPWGLFHHAACATWFRELFTSSWHRNAFADRAWFFCYFKLQYSDEITMQRPHSELHTFHILHQSSLEDFCTAFFYVPFFNLSVFCPYISMILLHTVEAP